VVKFEIRRLPYDLTAHGGLPLVGQHLKRHALVDQVIDPLYPIQGNKGGLSTGSIVRSYLGLLCTAKSDFDAIENWRRDEFVARALGVAKIPSSPALRQRLDVLGADGDRALYAIDEINFNLLRRAKIAITALPTGHVPFDFDVFTMDNSNTAKEGVSRTYANYHGYAPIAGYLGLEGWCVGLELREGSQHSAEETPEFLGRVLPRIFTLTQKPILARADSGFDGGEIVAALLAHRPRCNIDLLIKWNPRGFSVEAAHQQRADDPATSWQTPRPGKRIALWSQPMVRGGHTLRCVMRLTERTIDKKGKKLLYPDLKLEGWLTTLDLPEAKVIALYEDHATHEQFHSEFKSDLDLERLPSGKFGTNDVVMALAMVAYNILRTIGQNTLIGQHAPVRHPAKRRRLRTVIQEIIGVAARMTRHARKWSLGLANNCPAFQVFRDHYVDLCCTG